MEPKLVGTLPQVGELAWIVYRTTEWVEAATHPAIMDTTKAREQLGWKPKYTAVQALRETLAR